MEPDIIIQDDYIEFKDKTWLHKVGFVLLLIVDFVYLISKFKDDFFDIINVLFAIIYTIFPLYILLTSSFKKIVTFNEIESVKIDSTWRNRIKFKLKSGKSRRVWTKCDNQSYELIKENLEVDVKYS